MTLNAGVKTSPAQETAMVETLQQNLNIAVSRGELNPDPAQKSAALALDDLLGTIHNLPQQGFLSRLLRRGPIVPVLQGVYLYGRVGGGKTMLMDMFYNHLPPDMPARRIHFHRFMIEAQDFLHKHRQRVDKDGKDMDTWLPALARHIADNARILCFDEFHVENVADAIILSRLFTKLFDTGAFCVMTSNQPPNELYAHGLQRDRFVPFIDLIHDRMRVIELDAAKDYREALIQASGTYFSPLNEVTQQQLDRLFTELSNHTRPNVQSIAVRGRTLSLEAADGVARADFQQLCETPLGAEDYGEIARHYHTLILEGVPQLEDDRRNAVKRLMTLIDVLYDQGRNLIIAAETPPEMLYNGDEYTSAFQRTVSRLKGMASS